MKVHQAGGGTINWYLEQEVGREKLETTIHWDGESKDGRTKKDSKEH